MQILRQITGRKIKTNSTFQFLILVLPALALFTIFMLYPLVDMFRLSLFDWNGILSQKKFIGLQNFIDLFSNDTFLIAAKNTFIHVAFALPGVIIPAFMLGFFLSLRPKGYRILRAIFFLPIMISAAALGLIFLIVYSPDGILNTFLGFVGLESLQRIWLSNIQTALYAIIVVDFWADIGLHSVLLFAACSSISPELIEAAKIDGATMWKIMWKIAFPMMKDFIGISIVLQLLWLLLGSAQTVLLLTKGGPGTASLTLGYYLYELAFINNRLGMSQAVGVIIFLIGIISLIIVRRFTRQESN
ncbi:MAG TPA: sugar ABC transporter permease [Anaerolineaceae bacterium]|nr:sugar ABC transporter permease [Anaerolineaceae bacterium]